MRFTPADLAADFEPQIVARGKQYWQQHRVKKFELANGTDEALTIHADVEGSESQTYSLHVTAIQRQKRLSFDNRCSCPMEGDCKHVVAALFEACNRFQRGDIQAAAKPSAQELPEEINDWLELVERAQMARPPAPADKKRLVYQFAPDRWTQHIRLALGTVKLQKDGSLAEGEMEPYYGADSALRSAPQKFMYEEDLELLRALAPYRAGQGAAEYDLKGQAAPLLRRVLATGRAYWKDVSKPLTEGAPRNAQVDWQSHDDGSQQLALHVQPPADALLPLAPPWYVDEAAGQMGELSTLLPPKLAALMADAPRLPPETLIRVSERLTRVASAELIPPPRSRGVRAVKHARMTPVLFLYGRERKSAYFNAPHTSLAAARLLLDYQGARVSPQEPGEFITRVEGAEILQILRHGAAERRALQTLVSIAPFGEAQEALQAWEREGIAPHDLVLTGPQAEQAWADFVLSALPRLQEEGWKIEYDLSFPHRYAHIEHWFGDARPDKKQEWFDLELGIQVDGHKVNLLPLLVQALRANAAELTAERLKDPENSVLSLTLPDGRRVALPLARVAQILQTLIELYEGEPLDEKGRLRLSRLDVLRLAELQKANAAAALRWFGDDSLVVLGEKMKDFAGIAQVSAPAGLRATLRDYQLQGLSWLQFLREYGFGGILADDMGLGKTVQTLAHILIEKEQGRLTKPALVVAPTSLVGNWVREANQFAPGLRVLPLHGQMRKQQFDRMGEHDLVITTYPLLPRDKEQLQRQEFHLLVLDEAQNIKNAKSLAAQLVQQLDARHRLCLTGTPMENHLGELWSQFHFLQPGLLGDAAQFKRLYRTPIEKNADDERRAHLVRRISPFILRRTKTEVVKELPPKTEVLRTVALDGAQRDLYETVRLALHEKVRDEIKEKGLGRSHIIILDALLKLRQVCCDPRLLKMEAARKADGSSAKLQLLMDILPEMLEEGRRVLLFSQFTSMLELIEQELNGLGIRYLKLTGETQARQSLVDSFQRGDAPLFLISLKAGGVGLNLTAADSVIHYDPWWNPAVENQATDRAYRIGQDKPVFVYKLVIEGSIEEKIQALQARKAALAASILDGGSDGAPQFTSEDLQALFEPLA